jgi:hypothetical protein
MNMVVQVTLKGYSTNRLVPPRRVVGDAMPGRRLFEWQVALQRFVAAF